jgi:hypothetical protein
MCTIGRFAQVTSRLRCPLRELPLRKSRGVPNREAPGAIELNLYDEPKGEDPVSRLRLLLRGAQEDTNKTLCYGVAYGYKQRLQ